MAIVYHKIPVKQMSDVQNSGDPYEIVLRDLREQRDRIDNAISAIQTIRGVSLAGSIVGTGSMTGELSVGKATDSLGAGAFLGLSIVDASKKLLTHERRQMSNSEMVDGLKRGGLALNSADPLNTVGSVLNRRFIQVGDVVRVARGTWGLKEWYPNRSFKTKAGEGSRPTDKDLQDLGLAETIDAPDLTVEDLLDDTSDLA